MISRHTLMPVAIMLAVAGVLLVNLSPVSAGGDGGKEPRPLDLPSGGAGSEDDEDHPEAITFYGATFEAEGFFWVLDRSGSMEGQAMATLKEQLASVIKQLSARTDFGIVSFSDNVTHWPANMKPAQGNSRNKAQATGWVMNLQAMGWTCMHTAVTRIFKISNASRKRSKLVILVGDGVPRCGSMNNIVDEETLEAIAAANFERTKVNTIFINSIEPDSLGISFFSTVARLYNGEFMTVD